MDQEQIPNHYVFVWDNDFFPYYGYLAIKSVAIQCQPERIYLLKTPRFNDDANFQRLQREVDCLRHVDIDIHAWLAESGLACSEELVKAHEFLGERRYYAAISDLLRSLFLYLHGGIYLDLDTLALGNLAPLRVHGAFLAEERILVSSAVYRSNSWLRYLRTAPLTLVRDLCSRFARGVQIYQSLTPLFVLAANNAVMGCRPGHPLMRDVLIGITERYRDVPKRYSLVGPDLLQDLIVENSYEGLQILPPRLFYPLGPTMNRQYFNRYAPRVVERIASQVIHPEMLVLHWINNVALTAEVPRSDEDIARLEQRQLFSRLARRVVFPDGVH